MRKIFNSGADQVLAKPPPKLVVTVHIVLPAHGRGFKDVDPSDVDTRALLSRVAKDHKVKIDAEESDSFVTVTVKATHRPAAKDAIAVLRERLLYQPGEEAVWRTQLMVHPPKAGKSYFTAVLQHKEGTIGRRVVAQETTGLKPVNTDDVAAVELEYRDELTRSLDLTAKILRQNPNGMRMRVLFGTLVLDEWPKNKTDYNFAELTNLVHRAGGRGTAHMELTLNEISVKTLRGRLTSSNMELPESVREYLELELEHAHSLIVETKNLRVESTLEPVQAQGNWKESTKESRQFTLGPFKTSLQEKQPKKAEIATACPEGLHDWALEIRHRIADDVKNSAPFTVQELERNLRFKGDALRDDFPDVTISPQFLSRHDVTKVYSKETWRYMLSMRYVVEINLFREMGQQKSAVAPGARGTVALYSEDWDEDMRAGALPPRQWNDSFSEQFLRQSDGETAPGELPGQAAQPMEHLLLWIKWIRSVLDESVDGKGSSGTM
ncbi:e0d32aa4-3942-40ed-89d1-57838db8bd8e [Thermothielavioides terrestris]|uniref:DUF7905 domain-containing protein n=2 Tax=Thermothielavioides terrestris TaxID=2587410 RepID=G2QYL6_THETT|nr:uncharacterized protein THITE_2143130 [Thermothielavioides terrestris NRRL 8126]AEO65404.1 hypothetical protein THITE_2143130 [Thermothielavioides terrestris NRRL 8126]SPQ19341.1 e0d32aa4-3942-40ed-89d1-57838db8bd8e [Thermothielavioides terrestris]